MGECSTQLKRRETEKLEIGVRVGKLIIGNGGSGVNKNLVMFGLHHDLFQSCEFA